MCWKWFLNLTVKLLFHFFPTELSINTVHQTPTAIVTNLEDEGLINCNHSNTNFNTIQWYKQAAGKTDMTLVGAARFSNAVVEDSFKDSYNVSGDGKSRSSLHILKQGSELRAVYFCAASEAQCSHHPSNWAQKPSHSPADNLMRNKQTTDFWYQAAGLAWDELDSHFLYKVTVHV